MFRLLLALLLLPVATHAEEKAMQKAVFAGGCFWCLEAAYEKVPGVSAAVSGYSGGTEANPTYEQVSTKQTGHKEVVEVTYNPTVISYDKLLEIFWHNIDPLDAGGQFCDRGPQYQSAIFVANDAEREAVTASMKAMEEKLGQKIVTLVLPASTFWPAEKYHQDYAENNPFRYGYYRSGCGRDARLRAVWGKDAGGH